MTSRIHWALAYHRFGEKTDEQKAQARAWVEPLLHDLRHGEEHRVIRTLEEVLRTREGRQETVKTQIQYFRTHRDHLHYRAVESLCSQLQNRFKRTGQFWTRSGWRHLLAVEEAIRNRDFDPRCK